MTDPMTAKQLRVEAARSIGELLLVSRKWRRESLSEERPDPGADQPGSVREAAAAAALLIESNEALWGDGVSGRGYRAVLPLLRRSAQLAGDIEEHYAAGEFGQNPDILPHIRETMRELGGVEVEITKFLPAFYIPD